MAAPPTGTGGSLGATATDVEFALEVRDTLTNAVWVGRNLPGTLAPASADTRAFPGCGTAGTPP
jgi:hypothetical protein